MSFEIIGKKNISNKISERYSDIPVLKFNKNNSLFNLTAIDLLKLEENSEVIFSVNKNIIYIAIVTDNWRDGSIIKFKGSKTSCFFWSKLIRERIGAEVRTYQINTIPEWEESNKLDWFELTLI